MHIKWSVNDIQHLVTSRNQWRRDITTLINQWVLKKTSKKWTYEYIQNSRVYLQKPFFERKKVTYNPRFLESYIPNKTSFLNAMQKKRLLASTEHLDLNTTSYLNNKKKLETILIDISFSSSSLEWNTYSYLDTEVLIKYAEIAEAKAKEETTMILNHKKCLEYLLYTKKSLNYSEKTRSEIHTLLATNLLPSSQLWTIRNSPVDIGGSQYTPLWTYNELKAAFDEFLNKLNQIQNPREQSLFILVFIPYFQLFADVNKRTSRMMCLLPLLKNNLPLLSLIEVKKKEYITAILAVYELNDVSLLATLYVENYLKWSSRY